MDLAFPDAAPNFLGIAVQARRLGQEDRKAQARDSALGMMATNPDGAAAALRAAGDFETANAVDAHTSDQHQRDFLKGRKPGEPIDPMAAAQQYGGDPGIYDTAAKLSAQERADATSRAQTLAAVGIQLLQKIPGDAPEAVQARKSAILGMKDDLVKRAGLTPDQVDQFQPTSANLHGVIGKAMTWDDALKSYEKANEGFTLSQGQTRFDGAGQPVAAIADKPEYKTVTNADGTTSVVVVGADGSGQPTQTRNNPGNIKDGPFARSLPGYKGADGKFAAFDTPQAGEAAQVHLLQSYGQRGINTVGGIINRWAPPSDNNPTGAYVDFVAKKLGVRPDQPLDLQNPQMAGAVAKAIAQFEGGPQSASKGAAPGEARVVATGNPGSGDAVMDDPTAEFAAGMYLTSGQMPPLGQGKVGSQNRARVMTKAKEIAEATGMTGADAAAAYMGNKSTVQALTTVRKQRAAISGFEQTALKNADLMLQLAPKGAGPTRSPVVNRWLQVGRKQVAGDPDVSNFDIAIGTFADEYAKIMSGATGGQGSTDSSRKEAYDRLSKYASQGQLTGGVSVMKREMANRMSSIEAEETRLSGSIRGASRGGGKPAAGNAADPLGIR